MKNKNTKALLIGCGNLGTTLLKSWIKHNTFNEIVVIQPSLSAKKSFENLPQLQFVKTNKDLPENFSPNVIIIATKSPQLSNSLPDPTHYDNSTLFISLTTGISINHFHQILGTSAHIIRLMPNLGIQVDQSLNLAYAPPSLSHEYKDLTHKAFGHSGQLIWLDNEELLDKLTPISSSGPAYFFLLTEIFADKISQNGVSKKTASKIAKQILLGSALLTKENHLPEEPTHAPTKNELTEIAFNALKTELPEFINQALDTTIKKLDQLIHHASNEVSITT